MKPKLKYVLMRQPPGARILFNWYRNVNWLEYRKLIVVSLRVPLGGSWRQKWASVWRSTCSATGEYESVWSTARHKCSDSVKRKLALTGLTRSESADTWEQPVWTEVTSTPWCEANVSWCLVLAATTWMWRYNSCYTQYSKTPQQQLWH